MKVKSTDYDLQEEQLKENKAIYQEKIEKYQLLVKSIKDNINYFEVLREVKDSDKIIIKFKVRDYVYNYVVK